MKNKKEFFAVLFSVLICVLVVFVGVYAGTTTIGSTIQVNGAGTDTSTNTEFGVIGTASISEDLWTSGSFQFGGGKTTASASYSRLGTGTTNHSLADADDLLVSGLLEVNDTAYFDGAVSLSHGGILTVGSILGHTDSGQYLIIGNAGTTTHALAANDDLLVSGKLEVDGTAYFDGLASMSDANGILVGGGAKLYGGTASPTQAAFPCAAGGWYFRGGQTASTSLYYCAPDDGWNVVIGIDSNQ